MAPRCPVTVIVLTRRGVATERNVVELSATPNGGVADVPATTDEWVAWDVAGVVIIL